MDGVEDRLTDLISRYVAGSGKGDLRRLCAALSSLIDRSDLRGDGSKDGGR
jgi:hypothetical protein